MQIRQQKLNQTLKAIEENDFDLAQKLFAQIITGMNGGRQADPGMAGSLLYHMAMVNKMESETQILLEELHADVPDVTEKLQEIYRDFENDARQLTLRIAPFYFDFQEISRTHLNSNEKIILFNN